MQRNDTEDTISLTLDEAEAASFPFVPIVAYLIEQLGGEVDIPMDDRLRRTVDLKIFIDLERDVINLKIVPVDENADE